MNASEWTLSAGGATRRWRGVRRWLPLAAAAICALVLYCGCSPALVRAESGFGLASFGTELSDTQAGAHADVTVSLGLNTDVATGAPLGELRRVRIALPPGVIGNPRAIPRCTPHEFVEVECQPSSEVGVMVTTFVLGGVPDTGPLPIYNLTPSAGHVATFGIDVLFFSMLVQLNVTREPDGEYGLTAEINDIPSYVPIAAASLQLWGVPGDPSHEALRVDELGTIEPHPATVPVVPFMTNGFDCDVAQRTATVSVESWEEPGNPSTGTATMPSPTGCSLPRFAPTLSVAPATTQRDTPSAYEVALNVPQDEEPYGLATPAPKRVEVRLPPGTSLSPAAANGLEACSDTQFAAGECPNAAKVGTVALRSALLSEPLTGAIYLGSPTPEHPYRLFLAPAGDSVHITLEGTLTPDENTGQLTAVFDDLPQLPYEQLRMSFFGGPDAVLANPERCGPAETTSKLAASSGQTASPATAFTVDADGRGGACPANAPFNPSFTAGSGSPLAGGFSPFTLLVAREDGQQQLSSIAAKLPPGLLGLLARVAPCVEARTASGACPASAAVGTATVGAGAGSQPLYLRGKVYLTGSYAGAPFGLAIVVPAAVGPFALGTIVVHARILVDPKTLQLTIASDPLPQILAGIPLRLRTVEIAIDREGFIVNPTDCAPQTIAGTIVSTTGALASLATPFQVGGCAGLPFAPKPTATTRAPGSAVGDGASLQVSIAAPAGGANLRGVAVQLPARLQSRLSTIQQACPAATFAAGPGECPAGSLVGSAGVRTPVLRAPLSGEMYLVSHGQSALPALEVRVAGEGVTAELEGAIKVSKQGVTTGVFRELPDVPIESLSLDLPAGPHSVLGATGNLCGKALGLPYTLVAQNGAEVRAGVKVAVSGCAKDPRRRRHGKTHR